jgi:hypothetical protein
MKSDHGQVRPSSVADVLLLMGYLWRVAPDQDGIRQGSHLTQIVLDGIRTGRPSDGHARQDTNNHVTRNPLARSLSGQTSPNAALEPEIPFAGALELDDLRARSLDIG